MPVAKPLHGATSTQATYKVDRVIIASGGNQVRMTSRAHRSVVLLTQINVYEGTGL